MPKKPLVGLSLLLAFGLVVAACGDDTENDASTDTTAPADGMGSPAGRFL